MCEGDHRCHHRPHLSVAVEVRHQRSVELDHVERQILGQAQRGVAGAEVVERNPDSQALDVLEHLASSLEVVHHRFLAHLEAQRASGKTMLGQRSADVLGEIELGQLAL